MQTTVITLHCDLCTRKRENVVITGPKPPPDGWGTISATVLQAGSKTPLVGKTPNFHDVCPTCIKRVAKKLTELASQTE